MTIQENQSSEPKLTIGIPVYNGERCIKKALESVLNQSYRDFTVVISDNASTDATALICREYLEKDSRITYVRQQTNIGAVNNFKFILNQCNSKYFVFLAVDDSWCPDFLQKNIAALDGNSKAVCSVSKVIFEKNGEQLRKSNGTYPLEGTAIENLKHYFMGHPNDNSRFYGVFRTAVFKKSFCSVRPFHAADWYIMAVTLMYGTHIEVDEVLMHREVAEHARYVRQSNIDNERFISRIFPVLQMTCSFMKLLGVGQILNLCWVLFILNIKKHREYVRFMRKGKN